MFESAIEKRRLRSAPSEWEQLDDAALLGLLAQATEVPKRRGRLIE